MAAGQRVLDLGSGVGDVAMLAARLVGVTGEVVGIERDAVSVAKARQRVEEAGFKNITFLQVDATEVESTQPFDAVVGRFILQFLPDPASVVRSLTKLLRPGGIVAFHEPTWPPFLLISSHVPLWSAAGAIIYETFLKSGVTADMGTRLHHVFRGAGLPAPTMRLEMLLGNDAEFTRWVPDLLSSLVPMIRKHGISTEALGDLNTLAERTKAEIIATDAVVPWIALVGAWSRKPD